METYRFPCGGFLAISRDGTTGGGKFCENSNCGYCSNPEKFKIKYQKYGAQGGSRTVEVEIKPPFFPAWISVKDRLPTESRFHSIYIVTMYSCYKMKIFVEPMHYINGMWFTMVHEEPLDMEYEVTHWMPLPEPPQ